MPGSSKASDEQLLSVLVAGRDGPQRTRSTIGGERNNFQLALLVARIGVVLGGIIGLHFVDRRHMVWLYNLASEGPPSIL